MMTDKQVIVDVVNVSECNFCEWKSSDIPQCRIRLASFEPTCKGYNCYYKQLKRKEQECEELKEEIDDLKEIIQRHDKDNNALLSEFEDDLVDYYRRYKECLTEIKGIAENMNKECFYDDFDCMNCDMQNGCTYFNKKQILQKISEVKNANI